MVARHHGHRQDRLVLVLRQVRERPEPGVEVGLARDHDRVPQLGRGAGDALARPHPRPVGRVVEAGAVRGAQLEHA
jgi:hypothetical protein